MLNLATAAAGEVTPGEAAKSIETVGAAVSAAVAVTSIVILGRRGSDRCVNTTTEASSTNPSGARTTQSDC